MEDNIQKKLQDLFVIYSNNLPKKIHDIDLQWRQQRIQLEASQFEALHRNVHSLCGSAGTYGYSEISKLARQLEIYLKSLLGHASISEPQHEKIKYHLTQLKMALRIPAPKNFPGFDGKFLERVENMLVYIVEQDLSLVNALSENLKLAGYTSNAFPNLPVLLAAVNEKPPIAIILDTFYLNPDSLKLVLDLQQGQATPIQLFAIVPNGELLPRLGAIRAGCNAFFQKPVDIAYLTQILNHKCRLTSDYPYRILIIDDSESLADYYALILNQAGLMTHAISNPLHLFDKLEEFRPDLLLMDIYMPECSGLELAAVLRLEGRYTKIPIIFLSTEDDKNKKLAAISLGGDDFLTKPILPQHLVSAVRARSKRASVLNYYMTTDGLTNLLNHSSLLRQLDLEFEYAQQKNSPLSFIMIDIDDFKLVNDSYGHPAGDIVIKYLANLLLARLRSQDVIGRYGGEEFAIILPGTTLEYSLKICNELRLQFASHCFSSNAGVYSVNFSAGISFLHPRNNAQSIVLEADQALYKAKQLGRNQVVAYELAKF